MQTLNNTLSGVHPLSAQEIPYWKQYYEANKQKRQEYHRKYTRKKYKENPDKFKCLMRQSVYNAFVRIKSNKPANTETLLGCTWQQAKEHFEKLFEPGMTWENHGEWHIDHIKPVSSFTMDNLHEMNCISNLQPLWAKDNLIKHNKIVNT